ncbi:NAD(P)-dependent oxidoreductase [Hoeflea poritis]|uniref:dihydrouracil dehydrogenase (NAD(+)) n=1 Tax=Hoeflea poritis TaxID=2993659 RepID=A0ABT4VIW4_9HYPH|nr:NAD(P)-dependent oxidoreductase [Hoeflea poritis]MDA4844649.1 NAD(P)-dependent oxidoreductase [Hoeflea poritis]
MASEVMRDVKAGRLEQSEYAENFSDIHPPLNAHEAAVEADRCYFCYDAPCMTACPTSIDVPMFIRQIAADNAKGAAKTIFEQNILGGMCARVCPTETLCEEACVREVAEGKPVKIGQLQRYATDVLMREASEHPFERAPSTGKRIAVVGAGPAGLSCAHRLAMHGHDVTVLEAREKGGGLSEYGIAAYKSVNDFAQEELQFILDIGGITIETGKKLGADFNLADLTGKYDAVFLGIGLANVNALGVAGEDADGCEDAVDYIAGLRQAADLSTLPIGRRVVVIGGGMTAIDIATQAKRLGAEEVTIAYRRGQDGMNASAYEQEVAQTSGVTIRHWLQPKAVVQDDAGAVAGIELEYTSQANGTLSGTGETTTIAADQIFKAIGQSFDDHPLAGSGLDMDRGRIRTGDDRKTNLANVWAGGDCVRSGEDLTVVSVEDGKIAAESIHATLTA